ncbi:MAG: M24 family metallopeptidase, partial [Candidatus Daviesbacteria bacterium]|nr:M24 family metallopeptidase [Candidatus Daviesbacteria bacterium]
DLAFDFILKKIQSGITEKEIAKELENFIKYKGAVISFPSIVAFGKNSSVPHHQTGDKRLTINDKLILLDFGVKINGYCSDMTRTIFFGKPSGKQRKIYETVLEAQKRAVDFVNKQIKNGKIIKAKEVDQVAREYIKSKGFFDIPHSLGHGIGLEVHEHPNLSPKSKDILKEGMVFSIEPGIYIQGEGGVRIEDLFVLEKGVLRKLTCAFVEPEIT